ncbi:hypothetical protein [Corynebacterium sp. p3-SID1194]|uniref:hypothetical protein n=1 Tax=Corynebacterium sp. p3-SID1194 TaxID=2916105 RepID=UPI0021A7EF41|nr:hypothetical protein [Corynebacterium sp. p3-SID1194]MCT1450654.1 hypothetical protein [Corynebacterium sp. p3-SID1194]
MAVTTELLGRLGGTPETRTVEITTSDRDVSIPAGWKKAVGVFKVDRTPYASIVSVFGCSLQPMVNGNQLSGGAVMSAGEKQELVNVSGTLTWYRLE